MRKNVYGKENLKTLSLIALIVGLPLLILSIYMIIDLGEIGYIFFISTAIFFIILFAFSINILKWRSRHKKIRQLGKKYEGKVVGFEYKYKSGNIRHDPPTPATEENWLKVQYVDDLGQTNIFETPPLAFTPEERKDICCDVYVYNDEVLATNFINLRKKKTDWSEVFWTIVIGIIFIGICYIISLFKR